MPVELVCSSHSPLMQFPGRITAEVEAAEAAMRTCAARIREFDPELVIEFGTDHYGGQRMNSMPCFTIARAAAALPDVGGTAGRLQVPQDASLALLNLVRERGVDAAWSHEMEVDHGFSQALQVYCDGVDRYPVLPIFINCIAPPFVPFARTRLLGAIVGEWARAQEKRILILGTGGLSHDPGIFFPPVTVAPEELRPYLIHGKSQEEMPRADWMARIEEGHRAVAPHIASDDVALDALHIHPEWDGEFLELMTRSSLEDLDKWNPEAVQSAFGIGTLEVHSWLAACAAGQAAGAAPPHVDFYAPLREYGLGFGLLSSAART